MKIWFCDLTHTGCGISSQVFPLGAGMIAARMKKFPEYEIELFKYPDKLTKRLKKEMPYMICFSNYIWNENLNCEFAKRIKKKYPKIKIVFGGPNFLLEEKKYKKWIKRRPYIDRVIRKIKFNDINEFPSPYLIGLMDKFFDGKLIPIIQTTRGCPYHCTFCQDGNNHMDKIYRFSPKRIKQELEYIAKRVKVPNIIIADSNFGMYKEDIKTAKVIAKIRKKYNWPKYIDCSTGKTDNVIKVAKILKGNMGFNVSAQSTDPEVVENIKRYNLSLMGMKRLARVGKKLNTNCNGEVILALPGDTKGKFFKSVFDMIDTGVNLLRCFHLIVLPGAEIGTEESRKKFGIKTKKRAMARTYGNYELFGKKFLCWEIEEVCTNTNTMSYKSYIDCRMLGLTIEIFYNNGIFKEFFDYINSKGIKSSELLKKIHEDIKHHKELNDLYNYFKFKIKKDFKKSILRGNILFETRAEAYIKYMKLLCYMVYENIDNLLHSSFCFHKEEYLDELLDYIFTRKTDLFKVDNVTTKDFGYYKKGSYLFYHTKEQRKLIKNYLKQYGNNLDGQSMILHKTQVNNLFRKVKKIA